MSKETLLVLEGKHSSNPAFAPALRKKGFEVEVVFNGIQAVSRLEQKKNLDAAVVNAAALRTSGKRICQSLREKSNSLPILLIVEEGTIVDKSCADAILILPFTAQKLVNRIRHLLPGDDNNIITAGPIRLDIKQRMVRCLGKKSRLTPLLVFLLSVLIQHRGEVVERRTLFSKVWKTNYTEDTRTLDVHISWLRRAIEVDPNKPRFLKTVRGVGYQLDV